MEVKDTEEFNNFMVKVNQVTDIIKNLNSKDPYLEKVGQLEADKFLNKNHENNAFNDIDEDKVITKIKFDRSVLNEKALKKTGENCEDGSMSKEAFMEEASKDADQRYKDRLVRMEKMETIKKQATLAFRRGDFEKALCLYNKAIELIKDSPLLYNNRCLTQIKLKLFDKAVEDAKTALKLNENCLRSFLLLAKAYFLKEEKEKFKEIIENAKILHPDELHFILGLSIL